MYAEAAYVIFNDGPGFDPSTLSEPAGPGSLEKSSGQGFTHADAHGPGHLQPDGASGDPGQGRETKGKQE